MSTGIWTFCWTLNVDCIPYETFHHYVTYLQFWPLPLRHVRVRKNSLLYVLGFLFRVILLPITMWISYKIVCKVHLCWFWSSVGIPVQTARRPRRARWAPPAPPPTTSSSPRRRPHCSSTSCSEFSFVTKAEHKGILYVDFLYHIGRAKKVFKVMLLPILALTEFYALH